jgi:hypothetical protein
MAVNADLVKSLEEALFRKHIVEVRLSSLFPDSANSERLAVREFLVRNLTSLHTTQLSDSSPFCSLDADDPGKLKNLALYGYIGI